MFLLPTSSSPLPPSPPFPLIPFLWPLYPSCNISSKNIPPVFCCAFHVYGKPTNFDLKFNESLLHWKNFQTITSSSTNSKVLHATFVVAKCRTQALVGHTKCMQEKHAYLVPFYPMKKKKNGFVLWPKDFLCFTWKWTAPLLLTMSLIPEFHSFPKLLWQQIWYNRISESTVCYCITLMAWSLDQISATCTANIC